MPLPIKKYFIFLIFLICLDQVTKQIVLNYLSYGEIIKVNEILNIVIIYNQGVTFGLLKADSNMQFYFLLSSIIIITSLVIYWWIKADNKIQRYAYTMILSGALGNICDRLRFQAVVDFLDFHLGNMHWYAFNIADSCIVCGVALLLIESIYQKKISTSH